MINSLSACVPPLENQPSPAPPSPTTAPQLIDTVAFSTNTPSVNILPSSTPTPFPLIQSGISITTPEEAIAAIKAHFAVVTNIVTAEPHTIGASQDIFVIPKDDGWNIVFWEGSGDCLSGCLNNHYWYFSVECNGQIAQVGEFERVYNSQSNDFVTKGIPLWGMPF